MSLDLEYLSSLFSQVVIYRDQRQQYIKENKSPEEIGRALILEERVMSHALMRVHRITLGAFKLSDIMHISVRQVQQRANAIVLFAIITFVILSFSISFFVIRSITRPLSRLVKSTEIIGAGDLDHKVDPMTKNEIGELAAAFMPSH